MTTLDANMVKTLREKTGIGMMDCKKALQETGGDFEKAIEYLRKKGMDTAQKRAGRSATEGTVATYVHMGGKIAVMVEVNSETDFVAKSDDFQVFAKDVAMHIAASAPRFVSIEEVPETFIAKEKEIFREQMKGKPENVIEKILEGKLAKVYEEVCLLEQPFVKDTSKKIKDCLTELIAKIGENVVIRRFARFAVGESAE